MSAVDKTQTVIVGEKASFQFQKFPGKLPADLFPPAPERFRFLRELGRGGMAVVYHAYDAVGEREVALKFITHYDDQDAVKRFRREATDLAAVYHPNIVNFYSAGEASTGSDYIEMEYVGGGTLKSFTETCDSLRAILRVFVRICDGLEHIHQRGMVHRDIKPANILINACGDPKISDLGLARRFSGRSDITQMGTVMGTAAYLAPEQIMSCTVGPEADLYALGITLFESVTGQHPFPVESPLAIIRAHLQEEAPLPSSVLPGLPGRLDQLIGALLRKDPLQRPQVGWLREELRLCGEEMTDQQDQLTHANPRSLLERARRHLDAERPEEALTLLDRVPFFQTNPRLIAETALQRARALLQQSHEDALSQARRAVDECRRLCPEELGHALLIQGKAAQRAGEWKEELDCLQEARGTLPSRAVELQVTLMEALAEWHEAGWPGFSVEEGRRYRELAAGLRLRDRSSSSGANYRVVFQPSPAPAKISRRPALAVVACLLTMLGLLGVVWSSSGGSTRVLPEGASPAPAMEATLSLAESLADNLPDLTEAEAPAIPLRRLQVPQRAETPAREPSVVHEPVVREPVDRKVVIARAELPRPTYKVAAPKAARRAAPAPQPVIEVPVVQGSFQPTPLPAAIEKPSARAALKSGTATRQEVVARAREKLRKTARARRERAREATSTSPVGYYGPTIRKTL